MLLQQQHNVLLGTVLAWMTVLSAGQVTLPTNCRERVHAEANSPIECARLSRRDLGLDKLKLKPEWKDPAAVKQSSGSEITYNNILNMWVTGAPSKDGTVSGLDQLYNKPFDPDLLPGACRWDLQRSNTLGSSEACMCPATEETCQENSECFWFEMSDSEDPSHVCINNAERFYYLLQKLLKKRGKNDFAIRIKYAGSPSNNVLPKGMLGKLMMINMLSKMYQSPSYSYGQSYGQSYNSGQYGQSSGRGQSYGQSQSSGHSYGQSSGQSYYGGQFYNTGYGQSYNTAYGQQSFG